ncbi:MAG: hypothetical protein ACOYI4_09505 [Christensenellales bacterium]|jgi:hypothetical protein
MAKASVTLTCTKCGKEFVHEQKNCGNRRDANNYEEWAIQNIDLCPECYGEKKRAEHANKVEKKAAELRLPKITSGTEKQIAWAEKIRYEVLTDPDYAMIVPPIRKMLAGEIPEGLKEKFPDASLEELFEIAVEPYPENKKVKLMLTSVDAKEIIDNRNR